MALTKNKGEWSEIYALFKLLGEGKMYAGDEHFNKIEEVFYPIISILRRESNNSDLQYDIKKSNIVVVSENGEEFVEMPCQRFLEQSAKMLSDMKNNTDRTFELPEIERFMSELRCYSVKAKPVEKADIRIVIHDFRTGINPQLGFSIKSQVGKRSTLVNPGHTTNIAYRIEGVAMDDEKKDFVNQLNKGSKMDLIGRVKWFYSNGGKLVFDHYENPVLRNNLMMVDTCLPDIIQRMLLFFYITDARTVIQLLEEVEKENFLNFDLNDYPLFYRRKVANMFVDAALGMVPGTKWNGKYLATGGYLIVKEDGDVLCYHFYNRNLFEDYLLNNTDFVTPGKHEKNNFGIVYKQGNSYFINLELQVRFLQ